MEIFKGKKVIATEIMLQIEKDYSDMDVCGLFDDEVADGNWIDIEQMEDEGYECFHEYYTDYGRGEAEDAVFEQILRKYDLLYDDFVEGDYEELQTLLCDYSGVNFGN